MLRIEEKKHVGAGKLSYEETLRFWDKSIGDIHRKFYPRLKGSLPDIISRGDHSYEDTLDTSNIRPGVDIASVVVHKYHQMIIKNVFERLSGVIDLDGSLAYVNMEDIRKNRGSMYRFEICYPESWDLYDNFDQIDLDIYFGKNASFTFKCKILNKLFADTIRDCVRLEYNMLKDKPMMDDYIKNSTKKSLDLGRGLLRYKNLSILDAGLNTASDSFWEIALIIILVFKRDVDRDITFEEWLDIFNNFKPFQKRIANFHIDFFGIFIKSISDYVPSKFDLYIGADEKTYILPRISVLDNMNEYYTKIKPGERVISLRTGCPALTIKFDYKGQSVGAIDFLHDWTIALARRYLFTDRE